MSRRNYRQETILKIMNHTKLQEEDILTYFNHLDKLGKVDLFKGMSSLLANFDLPRKTAGVVVLGWMNNLT